MNDLEKHNALIERMYLEKDEMQERIKLLEYALIIAATVTPRNVCTAWQNWQNCDFLKFYLDEAKKATKQYAEKAKECYWPTKDTKMKGGKSD